MTTQTEIDDLSDFLDRLKKAQAESAALYALGIISVENGQIHCADKKTFSLLAKGALIKSEWVGNDVHLTAHNHDLKFVFLPS